MKFNVFFVALLAARVVLATNYYCTQSGFGSGDGTLGNPCSVTYFNSTLTPSLGDTVFFSGTITGEVDPHVSGTAANRITYDFTAATVQNSNPGNLKAINIYNREVDNATFLGGIWGPGDAVTNVITDATPQSQMTNEILFNLGNTCTNILVANWTHMGLSNEMTIMSCANDTSSFITYSNCLMTNIEQFCMGYNIACHDVKVINCVAIQNSNTNWQSDIIVLAGGYNYTVQGCYLDLRSQGNQTHPNNSSRHNDCIQTFKGGGGGAISPYGWVICYNWIQQDAAPGSDGSESWLQFQDLANSPDGTIDAFQCYGNVFLGTHSGFPGNNGLNITRNPPYTGTATARHKIYNNTFICHAGPNPPIYPDETVVLYMKNNIVEGDPSVGFNAIYYGSLGGPIMASVDYNYEYGFTGNPGTKFTGAHGAVANPNFTDYANGNFKLLASSPCFGTADNTLGSPYNVGLAPGATWPNPMLETRGLHWDAGAYLSSSASIFPPGDLGVANP